MFTLQQKTFKQMAKSHELIEESGLRGSVVVDIEA